MSYKLYASYITLSPIHALLNRNEFISLRGGVAVQGSCRRHIIQGHSQPCREPQRCLLFIRTSHPLLYIIVVISSSYCRHVILVDLSIHQGSSTQRNDRHHSVIESPTKVVTSCISQGCQIRHKPLKMVLWGFRWLKLFLNPYANDDFEHISVRTCNPPHIENVLTVTGIRSQILYSGTTRRR